MLQAGALPREQHGASPPMWVLAGDLNTPIGSLQEWVKHLWCEDDPPEAHVKCQPALHNNNAHGDYVISQGFLSYHVDCTIGVCEKSRKHCSDAHNMLTLCGDIPCSSAGQDMRTAATAVRAKASSSQAESEHHTQPVQAKLPKPQPPSSARPSAPPRDSGTVAELLVGGVAPASYGNSSLVAPDSSTHVQGVSSKTPEGSVVPPGLELSCGATSPPPKASSTKAGVSAPPLPRPPDATSSTHDQGVSSKTLEGSVVPPATSALAVAAQVTSSRETNRSDQLLASLAYEAADTRTYSEAADAILQQIFGDPTAARGEKKGGPDCS